MWKPWIIAVVCTIALLNVSARSYSSNVETEEADYSVYDQDFGEAIDIVEGEFQYDEVEDQNDSEEKHEVEEFFDDLEEYKVKEEAPKVQFLAALSMGLDIVNTMWGIAKAIFSSETRNTIVAKVIKLGFDKLQTSTVIQMYQGVPAEKFQVIKGIIDRATETPTDKKQMLDEWWQLAEFLDGQTWNFQNLAFTKDTQGNAKYLALMYNKDDQGRYTFLVSDTKATFKVAQDMFIWEKFTSRWGGFVQKTEQRIEYRPHAVTLEEAQVLLNTFDTIALGKYSIFLQTFIESRKRLLVEESADLLE